MTGRWLRRLVFGAGWLGGAFAVHVAAYDSPWPPWVVVPLSYGAYLLGLDLLRRLLAAGRAREEITVFEDTIRDTLVFTVLGLVVVPVLHWAGTVAGAPLSPAVPVAAAYLVYTLWPRDDR